MPSRDELAAAVDACACFQLRRASRAVTQLYDAALEPTGLRSTQFVLLAMTSIEGPVPQPQLAAALGMERSTLSRNLKRLDADGFIRRERRQGERHTTVSMTRRGARKLESALPYWANVQSSFTAELGAASWDSLRQRLRQAAEVARDH